MPDCSIKGRSTCALLSRQYSLQRGQPDGLSCQAVSCVPPSMNIWCQDRSCLMSAPAVGCSRRPPELIGPAAVKSICWGCNPGVAGVKSISPTVVSGYGQAPQPALSGCCGTMMTRVAWVLQTRVWAGRQQHHSQSPRSVFLSLCTFQQSKCAAPARPTARRQVCQS